MAVQFGPCVDVFILSAIELLDDIPQGDLVTPFELLAIDLISSVKINAFPYPPAAHGFLIDVDTESAIEGITRTYTSALLPVEEYFLEPTTGQIWPRG